MSAIGGRTFDSIYLYRYNILYMCVYICTYMEYSILRAVLVSRAICILNFASLRDYPREPLRTEEHSVTNKSVNETKTIVTENDRERMIAEVQRQNYRDKDRLSIDFL